MQYYFQKDHWELRHSFEQYQTLRVRKAPSVRTCFHEVMDTLYKHCLAHSSTIMAQKCIKFPIFYLYYQTVFTILHTIRWEKKQQAQCTPLNFESWQLHIRFYIDKKIFSFLRVSAHLYYFQHTLTEKKRWRAKF